MGEDDFDYVEYARSLIDQAETMISNGMYEEALEVLYKLMNEVSGLEEYAYYKIGFVYFITNNYNEALKNLKKSVKLDKEGTYLEDTYAYIGRIYQIKNKYSEAEKYYKKALVQNSNNEITLYYWGQFLEFIKKDHKKAEIVALKTLEIDAQDADNIQLYADIQESLGNYELAGKEYRKAIEIAPNNAMLLNNYGYFLMNHTDNPQLAKEYFYKAIELEPDNDLFKKNLNNAIVSCIPFWRKINNFTRPIMESKFANFIPFIAALIPFILKLLGKAVRFGYIRGIWVKIVIVIVFLFVGYGLIILILSIITSLLIKLKILK